MVTMAKQAKSVIRRQRRCVSLPNSAIATNAGAGALSFGLALSLCLSSLDANAQQSPEYMPSDVLLLIDTSGSMSYTTVREPGDETRYGLPRCGDYDAPDLASKSKRMTFEVGAYFADGLPTPADRWAILVNAFTGTITNPSCSSHNRSSASFMQEFGLGNTPGTTALYDSDYHLPFNRIVATNSTGTQKCTPAPSWNRAYRDAFFASTGDPMAWPEDGIAPVVWRDMSLPFDAINNSCPFEPQGEDGIIDRLESTVRFGIMTFDPIPHKPDGTIGTGLLDPPAPDYASGSADSWSYFPGWMTYPGGGTPVTGWPPGCLRPGETAKLYEVGARNPAAPPWEGRLIGFGNPTASMNEIREHNARVQQAILGMRPYGGTPIAGMLSDALFFLTQDDTQPVSLSSTSHDFYGGAVDPYVHMADRTYRGCRKRIALLVTDGGPNLDLQPHCQQVAPGVGSSAGRCPYRTPHEYAQELYDHNIDLFVVGFSVTASRDGATLTCEQLMDPASAAHRECTSLPSCTDACGANSCAYGYCISTPTEELLAVCCNLEAIANAGSRYDESDGIALAGTPRHAYWAESGAALVTTISSILRFPTSVLTRTQPVFAVGSLGSTSGAAPDHRIAGSKFYSSFDPIEDDLFAGHLVRARYECVAADPSDTSSGIVAREVAVDPDRGDRFDNNVNGESPTFSSRADRNVYTVIADADPVSGFIFSNQSVRPMLSLGSNPDGIGGTRGETISHPASEFVTNVAPGALFGRNRCEAHGTECCANTSTADRAGECRSRFLSLQLGFKDPNDSANEYVRSSALGAMINSTPVIVTAPTGYLRDESYQLYQSNYSRRPAILYAATADGQVHAFEIDKLSRDLNELWTFMPPAVLPSIADQFPSRAGAANKTIISGPLVAAEVSGDVETAAGTGHFLTRTAPNGEVQDRSKWYSVLVGSFGAFGGYFAVDVTNPTQTQLESGRSVGLRFLWQLTTDSDGNPLFGAKTTRPAIATLYFTMPGTAGSAPAQHAVAILPGGYGGIRSASLTELPPDMTNAAVAMDITPRASTARYSPTNTDGARDRLELAGARSITIVRLDTGEIVRTFRRNAEYDPANPEAPRVLYDVNRVAFAPFAAPIVGSVVAYPNSTGSVADRAYVGDAEGRLWRLDLSSSDPRDWSVALFHDAYPLSGPGALSGGSYSNEDVEAIETPPILSTDPLGRLTVAVSTGEQTSIGQTGMHSVWSLSEWRANGGVASHVNWFINSTNGNAGDGIVHFSRGTGERVTGPMALFSSALYFTTYDPSSRSTRTCIPGHSYLWGVHYIQAGSTDMVAVDTPGSGPLPALFNSDTLEYSRLYRIDGGMAFGVGVEQKPSCVVTSNPGDDDPFGLSAHRSVASVSPGAFQLLVQVGTNQLSSGSWGRVDAFDLATPSARSQIDSWATILD